MNRSEVIGLINLAIEDGNTPYVHPNGMIQLKLSDGRRMHFWDKEIPRQEVSTLIHNHVFDMQSEIVAGTLLHRQVNIHIQSDGFYDVYDAVTVEGVETKLVNTGNRARADHQRWLTFKAGEVYDFPAGNFHETSDREGPCISIITKGWESQQDPSVLVEHGKKPDNDFERGAFDLIKLLDTISRITHELLPIDCAALNSLH